MTAARLTALAATLLIMIGASPSAAQDIEQQRKVQVGEPTASGRTVIEAGHVDLGPRLIDGEFQIQIRDDSADPPTWRDPSDVVLTVPAAAALQIPDDRRFAFLGQAGARSYVLPQVQNPTLVWPGWNTQDPAITGAVKREVGWTLDRVSGPGRFSLFSSDGFGDPQILFDSARPLPQHFAIELDTHGHGNWAFSAPGAYALTVAMTADGKDGARLSDRATLQFAVGDTDPQTAFAAATSSDNAIGAGGSAPLLLLIVAGVTALGLATLFWRRRTARTTAVEAR